MVNFSVEREDAGIIKITNRSTDLQSGIVEGILQIRELALEFELNGTSSPTLTQFLSASSSIIVPAKIDEVLSIELILLIPLTGATYHNGQNSIVKLNVFNEVRDFLHVYTNEKLYTIDKGYSTQHELILTTPLVNPDLTIYKAYYKKICYTSLWNVVGRLKDTIFAQGDCNCKTCDDEKKKIDEALRYIQALNLGPDCDTQRKFLACLKSVLDIKEHCD